jgi:hypothetical protein
MDRFRDGERGRGRRERGRERGREREREYVYLLCGIAPPTPLQWIQSAEMPHIQQQALLEKNQSCHGAGYECPVTGPERRMQSGFDIRWSQDTVSDSYSGGGE